MTVWFSHVSRLSPVDLSSRASNARHSYRSTLFGSVRFARQELPAGLHYFDTNTRSPCELPRASLHLRGEDYGSFTLSGKRLSLLSVAGVEPATFRSKYECSTIELYQV